MTTFDGVPTAPTHIECVCGHPRWCHYDLARSCMKCLCKAFVRKVAT